MTTLNLRMLGWQEEVPSGVVNSSNVTFTLSYTPDSKTLILSLDGLIRKRTTDYTISGSTITMVTAPALGQELYAVYRKA
jgi:hypothetical protein